MLAALGGCPLLTDGVKMTDPLAAADFQAILQSSAEARYDYFLQQALATGCVWTLRADDGGVLMSAEGQECMPIWPSQAFAEAWAEGDWADCAPFRIELAAWLQRWLPGMQADGLRVVVFPGEAEDGLVLGPQELKQDIQSSR